MTMHLGCGLIWEEAKKDLSRNVVRVLFQKVDGNYREMYATRNPEIIARNSEYRPDEGWLKGSDSHDLLVMQKTQNLLIVFDLLAQDYRKISLDRVVSFDEFYGVPGWISFSPSEKWDQIMFGEIDIKKYYNLEV